MLLERPINEKKSSHRKSCAHAPKLDDEIKD